MVYAVWAQRERHESERRLAQYAIASVLSDTTTLEDAAPRIMRAVCVSLRWDVGALWLVDAERERLRFIDMWARPGVDADAFAADSPAADVLRCGEGMLGRCWKSAEAHWVSDLEREPLKRRDMLLGRASEARSASRSPARAR
jgi:hypothetical protein